MAKKPHTSRPESRKVYLSRIAECDGVVLPLLVMIRERILPEEVGASALKEHAAFRDLARSFLRYDKQWCEASLKINAHREDHLDELIDRYNDEPEEYWTPWLTTFFGGERIDIDVVTSHATKRQLNEFHKLRHVFPPIIRLHEVKE